MATVTKDGPDYPSLRQLTYFIAVADTGSFRAAAGQLNVSQPTITAQIATLEQTLGVKLFERNRSGTQLSVSGRELITYARQTLEQMNGLVEQARKQSDEPGGVFGLGVTPTLGPYLLPHVLPDLHRSYPSLRFHVREHAPNALEDELSAGRCDLILAPTPLNNPSFVVTPLFREPVYLVVAADHELAASAKIPAEQLLGAEILALEEHHRFYGQVELLCERLGARLLRDYQGSSLDALRHMVVMGMGHAFLPALYIKSEINDERQLRAIEIEREPIFRMHALAWRTSSPSRQFFSTVAASLKQSIRARLKNTVLVVGDKR